MKKFSKIKRVGHDQNQGMFDNPDDELIIKEKLDGANFRFTHSRNVDGVEGPRLVFGSRNVIYKNEKDTDSRFEHAVEHVREHVSPNDFIEHVEDGDDSLTIFGEAMHEHTLDYAWDDVPSVLVFDAYSERDGWLSWQSVRAIARRLGLETAPEVYFQRQYEDISELPDEIKSEYRDGPAEGIVVRSPTLGLRAKSRSEDFLDKHAGGAPSVVKGRTDDSAELARKLLAQEPWVDKWIHKYRDRDRTIEMAIMEDLWRDVFDDIIEEEYETIMLGNWDINTKDFRSIIASHVAEQLQAYLERPDDSVLNEPQDAA